MEEVAVASLRRRFDVLHDTGLAEHREALIAALDAADALIVRNRTRVDAELLDFAPRLRVVGRLGVGLDNIDIAACEARKIEVIPALGANALAVAEYVIGAAIVLLRGVYFATEAVASGEWPRAALGTRREIAGKTLGVVGFGSIGQLVGKLGRALGMTVTAFDAHIPASAVLWTEQHTTPRRLDD